MTDASLLRAALAANAALSLALGAVLAVAPSMAGDWLGVDIDPWLRLLGLALLGHGVALWVVRRAGVPVRWAWANLAVIAPYPLLMIVVVLVGLVDTAAGRALVLADGVAVGLLAVAQWWGLRSEPRADVTLGA